MTAEDMQMLIALVSQTVLHVKATQTSDAADDANRPVAAKWKDWSCQFRSATKSPSMA